MPLCWWILPASTNEIGLSINSADLSLTGDIGGPESFKIDRSVVNPLKSSLFLVSSLSNRRISSVVFCSRGGLGGSVRCRIVDRMLTGLLGWSPC